MDGKLFEFDIHKHFISAFQQNTLTFVCRVQVIKWESILIN